MPSIQELAIEFDLDRIAESLASAAKPSIYLESSPSSNDPVSRLGGLPNLPPAFEWPSWRDQPLPFIAQIDLRELPHAPSIGLPASGCLYLFYEGGLEAWGFTPSDKGSYQVAFAPDVTLASFPLRDAPEDIDPDMFFQPARLQPNTLGISLPDDQDQLLEEWSLSPEERERYSNLLETWRESQPPTWNRMGGYPEHIQGDSKLEAELVSHGIDCGGPEGYQEAERRGLGAGAADWELLLQIDSDENAQMMWGDLGRVYFLIRKQDLAQRNFGAAWISMQCS